MQSAVSAPKSAAFVQRVYRKEAGAFIMYAILETGGKQYRVQQGDVLYVEKLPHEELEIIEMDKIIAVGKDDGLVVGTPYVDGATVTAKVAKNGKSKKITVFTYRSKKSSKRKMGHRQPYTKVEILEIKA